MKNILVLLIMAICFTSCKKEELTVNIQGKWNWVQSTGGLAGSTITPETTGESRSIEISDKSFKYFSDDVLMNEWVYQIEKRTSVLDGKKYNMVILEDGVNKIIVTEGNRLFLTDDCYDCFVNEYVKSNL